MARLLLDENLPRRLARDFPGHEVSTIVGLRWFGVRNGNLLGRADGRFDVLITMDRGIQFQQSVRGRGIGILVLRAWSNRYEDLGPHARLIADSIAGVSPGTISELDLRDIPTQETSAPRPPGAGSPSA